MLHSIEHDSDLPSKSMNYQPAQIPNSSQDGQECTSVPYLTLPGYSHDYKWLNKLSNPEFPSEHWKHMCDGKHQSHPIDADHITRWFI